MQPERPIRSNPATPPSRVARARLAALVAVAAIVGASCGGDSGTSGAGELSMTLSEITTVPASTEAPAPATTAEPTPSTDEPLPTGAPSTTAEPVEQATRSLLLPGDVITSGETRELPYLALDADITLTGVDTVFRSYAELTGVAWTTLSSEDGSGSELTLANALTVATVSDPAWNGDASVSDPRMPMDDQTLEWFADQPAVVEASLFEIEPEAGITGRGLDYVIGDVSGIGATCFDITAPFDATTDEICASMIAFGTYLRSFPSGEEGTLFDLTIGTTRVLALAIGDGEELLSTIASTPRTLPADTIGAALVGDGTMPEGTTYAVPDMVDGHDVRVTGAAPGLGVLLDPGMLRITSPDQRQPVLSLFRGDVSYWNPDPAYIPELPVGEDRTGFPVSATFDAAGLAAQLPPSVTIVEPPSPITIGAYSGTQVVLQHTGPGLDYCPVACVNAMLQSTGRGAFLQDGVARRFVVVDVDGQPLVIVTTGPIGDAMLPLISIDASA